MFNFCMLVRLASAHTILIALMPDTKINIEQQLFDCGVNDVVVGRQTCTAVLIRRIQSHLKNGRLSPWLQTNNTMRLNGTLVDFDRREVWCNGAIRPLPGILPDLLKYFLDNPDRIISREELKNSHIWADSICSSPDDGGKTFDVHISKLRKIIETNPSMPKIIKSVRGIGWKLAQDLFYEH